MSDTSIGRGSYDDQMEGSSYRTSGGCWRNGGANICVVVLTIVTIILLAFIIYDCYTQYQLAKKIAEAKENGELTEEAVAIYSGGVYSGLFNLFSGDHDDDDDHADDDEYM